jgi:PAS domain S-box-containing protein
MTRGPSAYRTSLGAASLVVLLACVTAIDLVTPHGVTTGILYVPLVFCGLWFRSRPVVFGLAAIASVAIIAAALAKPSGEVASSIVIANRIIAIVVMWSVAALIDFMRRRASIFREAQQRLRASVDNAVDGFINIDDRGVIETFNPACERIFGYEAAEVIGRNIKMLMPEPYHSAHDDYLRHYLVTGEAQIIGTAGREVSAKRKDGSVFPMDLAIGEFTLADGRHFCGTVRDITARQKGEETAELLAAIVASSDDAIVSKTIERGIVIVSKTIEGGIITSWNPGAERLFGYSAAEAVGQHISLIIPPDRLEEELNIIAQMAAGKKIQHYETVRVAKDGRRVDISTSISPIRDNAGRVVGAAKVARDISAKKKSEEMVAHLAAIVASSGDAIMSKTTGGIITYWNVAAELLFGYGAAEAIGQHIHLIVPPDLWEDEERISALTRDGKSIQHYETVRINKDGRRIDISASMSPVHDKSGRVIGIAKVARDIKLRKVQEAELARHAVALERSNKELDDFAYIASHDLREPLRGLFNNAKFLQEDYADKLEPEGVKQLLRLGYLSQRMEQLVNDLFYFSRLGRQELAVQPTDINAIIRDIEMMSEASLQERNAVIVMPRPLPQISCDKARIAEVFRNLITNAVKYNDKAARSVEVGYLDEVRTKRGLERGVFYVKDNGIGIAAEFHEEIFRIFKRLNVEDDDKKGTGAGLTFVRKIVERHGGRVWLDSVPGEGTIFYFTIKQGPAYEAAA